MQYQIKHLGVGGILDHTVSLMKNHFGLFFGIVAATVVPVQLIFGFIQMQLMSSTIAEIEQGRMTELSMGTSFAILGLSLVLVIFVLPLANAAVIYGVGSTYLSRPTTVGACLRQGLNRWGALIWTTILMTIIIGLGFMLLIIPGIYFSFWYILSQDVTVLEGTSGGAALKRSKALTKGNLNTLFILLLLVGVINYAITFAAQMIPQPHVSLVVGALVQGVLTVFGTCALVVFYFSARCKLENFDLQLLADAVEET